MIKIKLLYIVSTLARSGPTNQLLNIIRNLDKERFDATVITLSPEPQDSLKAKYDELGVDVKTLGLSRIQGLLHSKKRLKQFIDSLEPSIIHTQGLRADTLLSKLDSPVPWVMTSRNYPFDDYPMKFGALKGQLMALTHISAMKKCHHVVACSKTIANQLGQHNVEAEPIQNGVHIENHSRTNSEAIVQTYESPIFISVGSLIARKNMSLLVDTFNQYFQHHKGSLIILGDGPERVKLESLAKSEKIHILGSVANVRDYLHAADYFVSTSLSEGLPNTVLEGLSAGLPALLSDIPSHLEIENESAKCSTIFALDSNTDELLEKLTAINEIFAADASEEAEQVAQSVFSAQSMSKKYQSLYQSIVNS
jgi:glycosyltransferase involved in cell wall biosynthesis